MRNSQSSEVIAPGSSILQQFTIGYNCYNPGTLSEKQPRKKSQKIIGANSCARHSKLAFSFKRHEPRISESIPANSDIIYPNDDYYREVQQSLMGENENLKDHNAFLIIQIKSLFEREKKYKKAILISKEKIDKLQELNQHLQNQLLMLTNGIIEEIERMQGLIQLDKSILVEELKDSGGYDIPKILEGLGEETEVTLNHNLEELKSRVNNLCNQNISRVTECQNSIYEEAFDPQDKTNTTGKHQSNPCSPTIFRDFSHGFTRKSQDLDCYDCYQPINQQGLNRRLPPKQR